MITEPEHRRMRNPFRDPLVSELIEDPERYQKMFSERILVGETLQVFQPANVVLVGPQGCGKSMILNLVRYSVLSEWINRTGAPPDVLKMIVPYFGIYVSLVRANFHVFGRRSVNRHHSGMEFHEINSIAASDYLCHLLFLEFAKGLRFLMTPEGQALADWLRLTKDAILNEVEVLGGLNSWFGYYVGASSLEQLCERAEMRLNGWRNFLNANIDSVPDEIWETKASMEECLHGMGKCLRNAGAPETPLSLFVVIDQYEALPELNASHGTYLQRVVNSLIKARDPFVSYKIGARTYDWGSELRIWGAESRIEVQRDYSITNLSDVLMRSEDRTKWIFPNFAKDVALRRIQEKGFNVTAEQLNQWLGPWTMHDESRRYLKGARIRQAIGRMPREIPAEMGVFLAELCGENPSPLDLRLAGAWYMQQRGNGISDTRILQQLGPERAGISSPLPWHEVWWRKERVGIALLQVASRANQKKLYYGWKTVIELSGSNITSLLLLCGEIWDVASKLDVPLLETVPPQIQTDAVYFASESWRSRDRQEKIGGRERYDVLTRLGFAIHDATVGDFAISNPGQSGFSVLEADLWTNERRERVALFLQRAVSWAILEERPHTSKHKESSRRKWYLHPLLSPVFAIPHTRVKEPLYVSVDDVYRWLFSNAKIAFKPAKRIRSSQRGTPSLFGPKTRLI